MADVCTKPSQKKARPDHWKPWSVLLGAGGSVCYLKYKFWHYVCLQLLLYAFRDRVVTVGSQPIVITSETKPPLPLLPRSLLITRKSIVALIKIKLTAYQETFLCKDIFLQSPRAVVWSSPTTSPTKPSDIHPEVHDYEKKKSGTKTHLRVRGGRAPGSWYDRCGWMVNDKIVMFLSVVFSFGVGFLDVLFAVVKKMLKREGYSSQIPWVTRSDLFLLKSPPSV